MSRNEEIREKDKIIEEKENIIINMRKMTMTDIHEPPQNVIDEDGEEEYTFDNLMKIIPTNKRMTEKPMLNKKILEGKQDNVYFRNEDYVMQQEDVSENNMSIEAELLSSPQMQKKPSSIYNKLKDIADNPEMLKDKVHKSPEKRLNRFGANLPEGDNFCLFGDNPNVALGPIAEMIKNNDEKSSLKSSSPQNVIELADNRRRSKNIIPEADEISSTSEVFSSSNLSPTHSEKD